MATPDNDTIANTLDEHTPLLQHPQQDTELPASNAHQARKLYLSHFLSTWNSRVFEFGAVLYLAKIFPGTLLPMSVYAFTRGLSALAFSSVVGQYIDVADRLQCVRLSIILQRAVVAASCVVFFLLSKQILHGEGCRKGMLALLAALSCFEKLASIMNLVSVEKDWVVVIARDDKKLLGILNAQMRRIDLLCKLFGPLFIGLIDGVSTEAAIVVNFAMNIVSIVAEYIAIARVYYNVPELQVPKRQQPSSPQPPDGPLHPATVVLRRNLSITHNFAHLRGILRQSFQDFTMYFNHRAFLPSIAGALLYLTVLSFAGQMVTYLLSAGYTAAQIAIARTFSVAFEVAATWVGPWLMMRVGPIRAGLWSSIWQSTCLVVGIVVFWVYRNADIPLVSASGLVIGTIVSRVGLRSFDLCTQLIVQEVSYCGTKITCTDGSKGRSGGQERCFFVGRSRMAKRV